LLLVFHKSIQRVHGKNAGCHIIQPMIMYKMVANAKKNIERVVEKYRVYKMLKQVMIIGVDDK